MTDMSFTYCFEKFLSEQLANNLKIQTGLKLQSFEALPFQTRAINNTMNNINKQNCISTMTIEELSVMLIDRDTIRTSKLTYNGEMDRGSFSGVGPASSVDVPRNLLFLHLSSSLIVAGFNIFCDSAVLWLRLSSPWCMRYDVIQCSRCISDATVQHDA